MIQRDRSPLAIAMMAALYCAVGRIDLADLEVIKLVTWVAIRQGLGDGAAS